MIKGKRVLSSIMALVMVLLLSTGVFADSRIEKSRMKLSKEETLKRVQEVAMKNGGSIVSMDSVNEANAILKFDTVEEFEKALPNLKLEVTTEVKEDPVDAVYNLSTNLITTLADTRQEIRTADNLCELVNGIWRTGLGTIRQKVVVNTTYDSYSGKYKFTQVVSKTSYIYYFSYTGWTWTSDAHTTSITDSQRTLTGSVNGHCTLQASIGGFGYGYTWDCNFYNEWGYLQ